MNMDAFEMREVHRHLLAKHRLYLLHNLRPTETFWSTLLARDVLSQDMIEEIKACRVLSSQVGLLLDMLPARGPAAFDQFCEALLECDHSHVAEYLKTLEATDHFRLEVQPLTSEVMLDRLVSIFKKNTPTVQRFAERKFELLLEEQERDLQQKEEENHSLDTQITMLNLEVSQLRNFLSSVTETSDNISHELQRDFLSKMFLREESKHLEKLRLSLQNINGFEKMCQFYVNMQKLLGYLERHAGIQNEAPSRHGAVTKAPSAQARSLHDKMTVLTHMIVDVVDDLGTRPNIQGHVLREELNKVLISLKDIMSDVWRIRDVFRSTVKQKRRLEGEVLSLLHNLQEIRRLEREVKEKQSHITDLNRQGQVMKKKTKQHKKQLEQIHLNLEQRKIQMQELQRTLDRQLNSADQRLHTMLTLLPDLEDGDYSRSDTDLTSDTGGSRVGTPYSRRTFTPAFNPSGDNSEHTQDNATLSGAEKANNDKPSETPRESSSKSSSGGTGGVLLERRRAKQGLLPREPTEISKDPPRKTARDPKGLTKGEKGTNSSRKTQVEKTQKSDGSKAGEGKNEGGIDIDSWVASEKSRNKNGELQQKLANFRPVPTQDRTAQMDNIRGDIDAKIQEITSRNKKPVDTDDTKPPPDAAQDNSTGSGERSNQESGERSNQESKSSSSSGQKEDMAAKDLKDHSKSGSGSSLGSRSGTSSDKENHVPNTSAHKPSALRLTSQELGSDNSQVQASDTQGAQPSNSTSSPTTARRTSRLGSDATLGVSMVCMDGDSHLTRQTTRYIEPDTWVPPKKRYNEREALKANKIEIRLPSK